MAGAIVVSPVKMKSLITRYEVTWLSDASGEVSGSVFMAKMGTIIAVEFVPGTGITQPVDLYDVDCLDVDGISVFDNGAGASVGSNLSNVTPSHHVPLGGLSGAAICRRWLRGGTLQPTVSNAGDTMSGVIKIYVADGVV